MLNSSTSARPQSFGGSFVMMGDDMIRYSRETWRVGDKEPQRNENVHGLDAEAELVGVLAEVIKQELDREIINDLNSFAGAGTVTWDKSVPAGMGQERTLTQAA